METRVLGVLAGGDTDADTLALWAASAELLVAADGGADALLDAGFCPAWIVGDLDSASARALACGARIHEDRDPDRSDCDKLLATIEGEGLGTAVTLAGVEGDRLDHVLATLFSAASSSLRVRFVFRKSLGWIVRAGERVEMLATPGRTVSLLPIGGPCRASLEGVRWPLADAQLGVGLTWSVSNEAGLRVAASVSEGVALLQIERLPAEPPLW